MESLYEQRFTKPDDALEKIAKLKSLDLSKISDLELKTLINSYFNIIPFTGGTVPIGTELFRVRLISQYDPPYKYTHQIFAPRENFVTDYGRANKPGERIFYCASNSRLATFEVVNNLIDFLDKTYEPVFAVIGTWKVKSELRVANLFHDPLVLQRRPDSKNAYENIQKLLFNGKIKEETAHSNNILLQYFSEEFAKVVNNTFEYKISNFYISSLKEGNSLISEKYRHEKFDGINYPSVASNLKGDNQAIFIDSAEKKLELIRAEHVVCANFDFSKLEDLSGVLNLGTSFISGEIMWNKQY